MQYTQLPSRSSSGPSTCGLLLEFAAGSWSDLIGQHQMIPCMLSQQTTNSNADEREHGNGNQSCLKFPVNYIAGDIPIFASAVIRKNNVVCNSKAEGNVPTQPK